ncbi:MAG: hypothetical protein LZF60_360087 [Nitrospira sp.]|nr:MAG: hypothetical protein LZF60_360087 [Nitrospira sp.]
MTVQALIQAYRTAHPTVGRESTRHAKWWSAQLGKEAAGTLTPALLLERLDRLASYGRSPSTVAFYLRFIRRVTAWATLMSYLPADPCAGMTLPKENTPAPRVLTEEEEVQLCSALGPPYALWVKFAIATGLTQSEQFTLRWRDVDLEHCAVLLPHSSTGTACTLTLPPPAIQILEALRQVHPPSMWVFPDRKNPSRPVNIHAFYVGRWVTAVNRAGIPWVAWKDLRHTCGVRLVKAGMAVEDITRFLRYREVRQAYTYRAWVAGRNPGEKSRPLPIEQLQSVADELQVVMLRDLERQPVTVEEASRLYAVHHLRDRPGRRNFEGIYRQFFKAWSQRPLESLTRKEIKVWYLGLAQVPTHANKALTFLRALFNWATDYELIACTNPALRIRRFPSVQRERFLTLEELRRFIQGLLPLKPKIRAYLLLVLFTGARRSEARTIQWADIDEHTRLWKKLKQKNGVAQFVPLPVQVMDALQRLPRTSAWIFPGQKGGAWSDAYPWKVWSVIRRRCNLENVRLHDIRRTTASYLAMQGENLPTIQSVLNHRSLAPTSIYARLNTKSVDRALQAQADRFSSLEGVIMRERRPVVIAHDQPPRQIESRDGISAATTEGKTDLQRPSENPAILPDMNRPTSAQPPAAPAVDHGEEIEWPG